MLTLAELVRIEHIVVGSDRTTAAEVIRELADLLAASGDVDPGYADACIRREASDPTGLPTAGAAVAIPHADPDAVRRPAIAVAVPATPITFAQMGDPDVHVEAEAIFLLALTRADEQLAALRQVASFVQGPDRLRALVAASAPGDVHAILLAHDQESDQ